MAWRIHASCSRPAAHGLGLAPLPERTGRIRLAARCHTPCRWMIPRGSYPMTRAGYLQWRNDLKAFHAEKAGQILREVGYPENVIGRVQDLNLKKNLSNDADSRVLEDALCLVFLQYHFPISPQRPPPTK